ncbi:TSUP family transporter [Veronia pacifica]|uniref:Probable membrane transporter protein n=1 Tax=Veronia pacifica TaxID=1080227 RepID=A0A1C3ERC5_9GAMM|nr:TSUP family transporter [Veronia pacifica]ODA35802.1 hypothetical protein A8L45_01830 [Veronia pacifica]
MPELFDTSMFSVLAAIAFSAGFIDAVAGGGGMLMIPALLSAGLPPHLALGTNKLAATFASSTAAITFYRKDLFSPNFWLKAGIATLFGAVFGTLIVNVIDTDWLEKALPVLIIATALYTIFSPSITGRRDQLPEKTSRLRKTQISQGLALGFYDGVAGPGTGAFWTVSTMSLYKLNMLLATGVAKAMNFISNITSLITFMILGHVNWVLGLTMGICLMAGAFVGAHSAIRFGSRFIRPIFITVVLVMSGKLAMDAWF